MSEFTDAFGEMLQHTVTVRAADGSDAWGTIEKEPVDVSGCMVQETTKKVQVGGSGTATVSTCQVYLDLENPGIDAFELLSKVTLPSGRESPVIQMDTMRLAGWPSHLIVYLE